MASNCSAYILCDDCDPTLLIDCPVRPSATAAPKVEVTTEATVLTVNSIHEVSGNVDTVQAPAGPAEKDTFVVHNASLHDITLQNNGGTADLAVLEPGGIVTYIYDGDAWRLY